MEEGYSRIDAAAYSWPWAFTPYLSVKLLPDIKTVEGGHAAIYDTPTYRRFRRVLGRVIHRKWLVTAAVIGSGFVNLIGLSPYAAQSLRTIARLTRRELAQSGGWEDISNANPGRRK